MKRRLVLIFSAFALFLGVMLVAACVAAEWRSDQLIWQRADRSTNTWRSASIQNGTTGVYVFWQHFEFHGLRDPLAYGKALAMPIGASHWTSAPQNFTPVGGRSRLGFGYSASPVTRDTVLGDGYSETFNQLHVPYWVLIPACLGAGLPSVRALIASIARRRGQRRLAARCCTSCGYDLRATPYGCPECGTVPHAPPLPRPG